MRANELMNIIECAFASGRIDSQIEMGVRSEYVRRADAEAILASRGFRKNTLTNWVNEGLVQELQGEKKNSPRKYSMRELSRAIMTINVKKAIL